MTGGSAALAESASSTRAQGHLRPFDDDGNTTSTGAVPYANGVETELLVHVDGVRIDVPAWMTRWERRTRSAAAGDGSNALIGLAGDAGDRVGAAIAGSRRRAEPRPGRGSPGPAQ